MTTTIPLSALPVVKFEWRRDQYGRYLIVPVGGGEPVGYTRATTVAATLDSGGGLAPWKSTMTACGLIMRRGLRAQWEALLAEHNGDPWYAGEQTKAACKVLVEECAAVGGANDRRDMGTSLHTITALVDVGRTPSFLTEETEADINAYVNGLIAAGVVIVPGQVEDTVVIDDYQVAGTFDRLVTVPGFDLPLIADLKTGADLSYSWQSIAVQLAIYSRGNCIYRQGPAEDGSEDQRLPMPAVDQEHGLIMWLDAGSGKLELFLVDLTAGWEAFEHSMWTRAWRNRKVAIPLSEYLPLPADDDLIPLLEASIAKVESEKAAPVEEPFTTDHEEQQDAERFWLDYRGWLQDRIDVVGRHEAARTDLAGNWPLGLPSLKSSADHTADQLAAIESLLDGVEARNSIPFGPSKPGQVDPVHRLLHLFPNSTLMTKEQ